MHPQIRQKGPGNCLICGMTLESVHPTAEPADNSELKDMTRRFVVAASLSLPLALVTMGSHLFQIEALHHWMMQPGYNWLQFAIATPVVLWAGWPFFVRGAQSLVTRNLNMFTLIGLGVGVNESRKLDFL